MLSAPKFDVFQGLFAMCLVCQNLVTSVGLISFSQSKTFEPTYPFSCVRSKKKSWNFLVWINLHIALNQVDQFIDCDNTTWASLLYLENPLYFLFNNAVWEFHMFENNTCSLRVVICKLLSPICIKPVIFLLLKLCFQCS